jgi:hypothetical protein
LICKAPVENPRGLLLVWSTRKPRECRPNLAQLDHKRVLVRAHRNPLDQKPDRVEGLAPERIVLESAGELGDLVPIDLRQVVGEHLAIGRLGHD